MNESGTDEMTTISMVLEKLRIRKRDNELRMMPGGLGTGSGKIYTAEDLKIIRTYRFEGASDPSDSSVLYVLEANDGLIGYSIDAYGVYSNHDDDGYDEFIRQLPVQEVEERCIFE